MDVVVYTTAFSFIVYPTVLAPSQVNLLAKGEVLYKQFYRVHTIVMEGDLPIATNECGKVLAFLWSRSMKKIIHGCAEMLFLSRVFNLDMSREKTTLITKF